MPTAHDDLRVQHIRPLLPPAILLEELPRSAAAQATVVSGRQAVANVVDGVDPRLIVVVGPCSVHDPAAALAYGERLHALATELRDDLVIVMRTYFEKPRTTVGWKGLINDPDLDGSFRVNQGLRRARELVLRLCELGLPVGTEWLDPITPQFLADLVAWGAIGARTTESQTHREMASGLSMPVGFKNGTGGSVQLAVDAVRAAQHPHRFLGVSKQGLAGIVATTGNPHCHVILRGGSAGPNYAEGPVRDAVRLLTSAGLPGRLMVDCSHANSGKDPERQPAVCEAVARQLPTGRISGVMLESFLEPGRQAIGPDLVFGQSVTDGCMGWETTAAVLRDLARARAKT